MKEETKEECKYTGGLSGNDKFIRCNDCGEDFVKPIPSLPEKLDIKLKDGFALTSPLEINIKINEIIDYLAKDR